MPPESDITNEEVEAGEPLLATSAESAASAGSAAPAASAAPKPPTDELLGTIYLGKYELISIIGSGGMGVIYKGKQIFLERIVAIKMLKNNLASVKARMRFHQEAKAASALNHPGIVGIVDFGVDDLERPYMIMEHVEGCTFGDLLRERYTLSFGDLLPIFLEICDALSEAHSKGVVHRDLKPSNIMLVTAGDDNVHIKLLDFGIAKMRDMQENTLQDLTKTGEALGTPLYMSPEQIMSKRVTARSDLYSLGCMLYACLTGAPPFIGQNKLDTMEKHCSEEALSIQEAAPDLTFPVGLNPIVMGLLEKNPDDRFASVDQFKDALIDLAVRNKLMPRLGNQTVGPGQLYLTGVIPPMPQSIVDMMPNLQATSAFDGSEGAKATEPQHRAGNSNDSTQSRTDYSKGRVYKDVEPRSLFNPSRKTLVLGMLCLVLAGIAGGGAFVLFKNKVAIEHPSSQVSSVKMPSNPIIHTQPMEVFAAEHLHSGGPKMVPKILAQIPQLLVLTVTDGDITDSEVAQLNKAANLLCLELIDGNLTDLSAAYLNQIPRLKTLCLRGNRSWPLSDRFLSILGQSKSLREFQTYQNRLITSKGVQELLAENLALRSLGFMRCQIDDSCAAAIAKSKTLHNLEISQDDRLTSVFLKNLAPLGDRLDYLNVSQDNLDGCKGHILAPFSQLTTLDIASNPLSADAVEDIAKMKSLEHLNIYHCNLSDEQIARLKKALPHTEIFLEFTETSLPLDGEAFVRRY